MKAGHEVDISSAGLLIDTRCVTWLQSTWALPSLCVWFILFPSRRDHVAEYSDRMKHATYVGSTQGAIPGIWGSFSKSGALSPVLWQLPRQYNNNYSHIGVRFLYSCNIWHLAWERYTAIIKTIWHNPHCDLKYTHTHTHKRTRLSFSIYIYLCVCVFMCVWSYF